MALLQPLSRELNAALDMRRVRAVAATVSALVRHSHRPPALLLSEMVACLASPNRAPAGTKLGEDHRRGKPRGSIVVPG